MAARPANAVQFGPVGFDLNPYRDDIADRHRRLRTAESFREPDRVPVCFALSGSFYCAMFGVDIGEYYAEPELQVEVQLKGLDWEYRELRADSCTRESIGYEPGPIQEAVVFGATIERPAGTSPRIVPLCATLDEVRALVAPPPADNPRLRAEIARAERFRRTAERLGAGVPVDVLTTMAIHPPLSCLCAIMDATAVYEAVAEEPERLRPALEACFSAYLAYTDRWLLAAGGPPVEAVWLADDNIASVSADAFRALEMPFYRRIADHYRPREFHLHTDGPNDQHFRALAGDAGVTHMDIGGFSSLAAAVREMKGRVYLHGGLNCKDLYGPGGLTLAARRKALDAITLAAPGGGFELAIGGETYAGVSPQAMCDLVRLADEHGRYPIPTVPA